MTDAIRIETLLTPRLELSPLRPDDAEEMVVVLGDESLHEFTGGHPLPLDALRRRYLRLATGGSPDGDPIWLNFIVRLRQDRIAVGTVQATVTGTAGRQHAHVAWVIGLRWQGQGMASEAAVSLVDWLTRNQVRTISANIHRNHVASQKVARRAGLQLTDEVVNGEQVWRR